MIDPIVIVIPHKEQEVTLANAVEMVGVAWASVCATDQKSLEAKIELGRICAGVKKLIPYTVEFGLWRERNFPDLSVKVIQTAMLVFRDSEERRASGRPVAKSEREAIGQVYSREAMRIAEREARQGYRAPEEETSLTDSVDQTEEHKIAVRNAGNALYFVRIGFEAEMARIMLLPTDAKKEEAVEYFTSAKNWANQTITAVLNGEIS